MIQKFDGKITSEKIGFLSTKKPVFVVITNCMPLIVLHDWHDKMKRYWISRRDDAQGPYATDELQMMLRTGEIQTSDQVRVQDEEEGVVVRELLRNKPSALQKEWARHQSRQAGFAARCLLAVVVGIWTVPAMRDVSLILSLGSQALATTLIAIQFIKGDKREAQRNLILAWVAVPLICWTLSLVIS